MFPDDCYALCCCLSISRTLLDHQVFTQCPVFVLNMRDIQEGCFVPLPALPLVHVTFIFVLCVCCLEPLRHQALLNVVICAFPFISQKDLARWLAGQKQPQQAENIWWSDSGRGSMTWHWKISCLGLYIYSDATVFLTFCFIIKCCFATPKMVVFCCFFFWGGGVML